MESRGVHTDERPKGRLAIARRSCDQCRTRKVGCDRGSPCSNCSAARLNCTHSAVASNATAPRQRVLISAQYEKKIDDIAEGIDGIKLFLQGLNLAPDAKQPEASSTRQLNQIDSAKPLIEHRSICASGSNSLWDHSVHIIDFVKAVVEDRCSGESEDESNGVLSSLKKLVQILEGPIATKDLSFQQAKVAAYQAGPPMPPLEAVVSVLRWAKDHQDYTRLVWVSHILPLEKFAEICRKVYFAIDDYSEVDFIIANAYLSYIFAEHVVVSGLQDYREYCRLCQENLRTASSRLPLLLPASMEAIAALTLGAFYAIENSKATIAWRFISTASDLCQRLGYHRLPRKGADPSIQTAQERLFWTVYKFERGLSLRHGRPSSIRDAEITLPTNPNELRSTKVARIQGKVYDELYSPVGLSRPDDERSRMAKILATELRDLISMARAEILDIDNQPRGSEADPMRIVYLQCDIVCQSSLLALILRAITTARGSLSSISDECVTVARETLDIHHECMTAVRSCKTDPFMVTKYINWAVLHTPFMPFSILFTRAVQLSDFADLVRLDRFATSMKPETPPDSITHPYRLYELLCQAARLYVESNTSSADMSITNALSDPLGEFDFTSFGMEVGVVSNETIETIVPQTFELGDWYYGNQQMMSLLDEDVMF
ncbi:uncharacterized protein GGS22DRAFT_192382 [Annulohypoxylon maeteangense]|uniref:uncharacterized protein n=1 Tax=Annulohypoxylon maeteangense TaxID=1927788 RepID=UPI002008519B|nr:uncharacterized protein GGS22DRAFT_192382 [Annulohypoxylon maeteangense]KAI0881294.1 hypothetical protein GGS22DRAFT_192382 [Annulohypoxylon maeteangense]